MSSGIVVAVCVSAEKGTEKRAVSSVLMREFWGIDGDGHAGEGHRQVSLLAAESIEEVREKLPGLTWGMFGENIVTRGLNLIDFGCGDWIWIGEHVLLEVTQIGKTCHNGGCPIKIATGDCIMPREGIFCRVLAGGRVSGGVPVRHVSNF